MYNNRRQLSRYRFEKAIQVSFSEQVVINGKIRDISERSAFIDIGNSVYIKQEDKLNFKIIVSAEEPKEEITGVARVSRVAPEDGIAIYFTELDEKSQELLKRLISDQKSFRSNRRY